MWVQRILEMAVSVMESYIPHTFFTFRAIMPRFNHVCFLAIKDRKAAYERYLILPSPTNHRLYVSARNGNKSTHAIKNFCVENIKTLVIQILLVTSGI